MIIYSDNFNHFRTFEKHYTIIYQLFDMLIGAFCNKKTFFESDIFENLECLKKRGLFI